jgi:predicted nucleic acid-binding Zn ribbon protein
MKISIANLLRPLSAYMTVLSYDIKDISEIFDILSDFIKNASKDCFEDKTPIKKAFKDVPLFLSDKGKELIKTKLYKYPKILETGKIELSPGYKDSNPNFIYLVGQFLTAVATKLDLLEVSDEDKYKSHKEDIAKLRSIWGNQENWNAINLFREYESKSNDLAKKDIEKKLQESAIVFKNLQ